MMQRLKVLVGVMGLALIALVLFVGLTTARGTLYREDVTAQVGPVSSAFTYQGRLVSNGAPVQDDCEMAFRLYDQQMDGSQVGTAITATVPITEGLFTANLDFGNGAFNGGARWLAIQVRCPADAVYADLDRQELTAAPYALYAVSAGNADTIDGLNASGLARISRYYIPGGGGTVTMTIPHYNAFQITIGEAYASPNKIAWLSVVENDTHIAWTGIQPDGTIVTGTASLSSTDTVMTVGPNITLRCPGVQNYELVLTSDYEDVRAFITW
ncbi:MAG: hypothetical protein E4H27_05710 [Anaerolineales bacterium]|nr:MAG: hypothetical protein E4H27_05710 [Anaerolineales bacterium]